MEKIHRATVAIRIEDNNGPEIIEYLKALGYKDVFHYTTSPVEGTCIYYVMDNYICSSRTEDEFAMSVITLSQARAISKEGFKAPLKDPSFEQLPGTFEAFFLTDNFKIESRHTNTLVKSLNAFTNRRHAEKVIAIAQISQLMPYYGGEITDEEWEDPHITKYVLYNSSGRLERGSDSSMRFFLAFHTEEQRERFIACNPEVVRDYLMLK